MLRNLDNDTYVDFGYMSTSEDSKIVGKFLENRTWGYFPAFLTINIPKNTNILILDNITDFKNSAYEKEILIKRKARFKVLTNKAIDSKRLYDSIGKFHLQGIEYIQKLELDFVGYIK